MYIGSTTVYVEVICSVFQIILSTKYSFVIFSHFLIDITFVVKESCSKYCFLYMSIFIKTSLEFVCVIPNL